MKNLIFAICGLLLPAFLLSQTAVTRNLPAFSRIGISGGYDSIILQEGNAESVTLEVNGIDPEKIITEVKGNSLEIKTQKGFRSKFQVKITVTYRNLTAVGNSGSSDIEAVSVIKADKFKLASSGSGDFKGSFDVRTLEVAISGSSDLTLQGKADHQKIAISGSGDVNASKLSGDTADVAISGSGNVKLGVSGKVKTAVSGSGRVTNN